MLPLFFLMLFSSMTITMPFSFIPKLVKWFGYSEVDTGSRVGILGASLYLGKLFSSFMWGLMADTFGRKRTMVVSGVLASSTCLLFGFSFNYWWAFTARFLLGLSGGLAVISKAILLEETDDTNRNLGMSILFGTISLGHILGPSIGGFLAFPHLRYPDVFKEDSAVTKFPILLPTAIVSFGMYLMLVMFWILVPADNKKAIPVDCREIGDNLTASKFKETLLPEEKNNSPSDDGNTSKLNSSFLQLKKIARNKVCIMWCILYGIYSFVCISYSEILPVYAATSTQYNGFGFSPADIGLLLMSIAVIAIVFQLTVFSRILDLLGLRTCFIICNLIAAVLFPLLPLCHIIQSNRHVFWAALISVTFIIRISMSMAFIAANLLVNTSVEKSLLASASGLCMTAGTIGRLIGVPIAGAVYSWSLANERNSSGKEEVLDFPFNHYFIFFILSIGTVLNATVAYFLPGSFNENKTADNNPVS